MADDVTASPDASNSLGIPAPVSVSTTKSAPSASSPLGPISQYRRPETPDIRHHQSVTGATPADPGRLHSRLPVEHDPDWASPVSWLATPVMQYSTSMLIYWFGYGVVQVFLVALAALLTGTFSQLSSNVMGAMLMLGPFFGLFSDLSLILTLGLALPLGIIFLVMEPIVAFLFFFSTEWRERRHCAILMVGLLVVRVIVYKVAIG